MLYKVKYINVSLLVINQLFVVAFAHFHALEVCPLLPNLPITFPRVSDDVKSFDNTLEVDLSFPNISVQGHQDGHAVRRGLQRPGGHER